MERPRLNSICKTQPSWCRVERKWTNSNSNELLNHGCRRGDAGKFWHPGGIQKCEQVQAKASAGGHNMTQSKPKWRVTSHVETCPNLPPSFTQNIFHVITIMFTLKCKLDMTRSDKLQDVACNTCDFRILAIVATAIDSFALQSRPLRLASSASLRWLCILCCSMSMDAPSRSSLASQFPHAAMHGHAGGFNSKGCSWNTWTVRCNEFVNPQSRDPQEPGSKESLCVFQDTVLVHICPHSVWHLSGKVLQIAWWTCAQSQKA